MTVLYFCQAMLLPAGGSKEATPAAVEANDQVSAAIQVTGLVRLVGSSRFPELVITGSEKQWFISREEMYKLHDLQQQTVTVEGEESLEERRFANGEIAGMRRELRNIRIIPVDE